MSELALAEPRRRPRRRCTLPCAGGGGGAAGDSSRLAQLQIVTALLSGAATVSDVAKIACTTVAGAVGASSAVLAALDADRRVLDVVRDETDSGPARVGLDDALPTAEAARAGPRGGISARPTGRATRCCPESATEPLPVALPLASHDQQRRGRCSLQWPKLPNRRDPQFQRLFNKFRIGKTRSPYCRSDDQQDLAPCRCGAATTATSRTRPRSSTWTAWRSFTAMTAAASACSCTASAAGWKCGAPNGLDAAVDSQIELEALRARLQPKAAFAEKQKEGVTHATAALNAGTKALDELCTGADACGVGHRAGPGGLTAEIRQLGS